MSRGRVVIVQSDWRTLWIDSGDPDTAQEFTRLFAGPADPRLDAPAALLRDAGLRVLEDGVDTIRGERLAPGAYATEFAAPATRVPGRAGGGGCGARFDEWRDELADRAARGAFGFSIERRVVVAEPR